VRGFMTDPEVLFLDEPTLGLDVGAARDVRQIVRGWMKDDANRAMLLTTHTLVEAEDLCDRVAIINKGKLLACDTPARLKQNLQRDAIFQVQLGLVHAVDEAVFSGLPGVNSLRYKQENGNGTLEVSLAEEAALAGVIAAVTAQQATILSLQKHEPSLEDVFVQLVGLRMEEVEHADAPQSE
jgi:ABC-2 type transport system ATP-binding protein